MQIGFKSNNNVNNNVIMKRNYIMAEENQIYVVQNLTMCNFFPFEFQIHDIVCEYLYNALHRRPGFKCYSMADHRNVL